MLSEKETFLVRVMLQKTREAGIECEFAQWSIDVINARISGCGLVVLYMDENDRPKSDVIQFLVDKMTDEGIQMIIVGERLAVDDVCSAIPTDLIYKIFFRPINNAEYVETVKDLFRKIDMGEYRKSILIVDDDPSYLNLVRDWLKGTYKVYMANSGLQAIKMLGKNKVDLILLDNEMPVTTGPMVLEMLRSDDETKDIPVMFLTGKGDKESVMAVLALRPEGYFLKNIRREELLENLKEYFILHK
ncbi:MAG: response regulator [Lachnospiraceae bacterium]|nr:response regulator [Lachnospiraceae bacterium]